MKEEREPHDGRSTNDGSGIEQDSLTTSLTDFIDEMDRAAFRRSLAGRDPAPRLELTAHAVQPRSKSS